MKNILIFLSMVFLTACNVEIKPINFGSDQCDYCSMNVVDKAHAAQFVTTKGKQYKFDAIECMVNYLLKNEGTKTKTMLISDYGNNGKMVDALTATYLISKNIKSPMGAYLSGFGSKEKAEQTQKEQSGNLFTWIALKEYFANK